MFNCLKCIDDKNTDNDMCKNLGFTLEKYNAQNSELEKSNIENVNGIVQMNNGTCFDRENKILILKAKRPNHLDATADSDSKGIKCSIVSERTLMSTQKDAVADETEHLQVDLGSVPNGKTVYQSLLVNAGEKNSTSVACENENLLSHCVADVHDQSYSYSAL